jgi:quercetin dioxygenase-like cupin family protein
MISPLESTGRGQQAWSSLDHLVPELLNDSPRFVDSFQAGDSPMCAIKSARDDTSRACRWSISSSTCPTVEGDQEICEEYMHSAMKYLSLGLVGVSVVIGLRATQGVGSEASRPEKPIFSTALPNVPGRTLTAILVTYQAGERSPAHKHAGSVLAYVISGAIRSENSATGPSKIFHAGEAFFEPPGSEHLVSENASDKEPASMLAIFIADDGARLTNPVP